MRDITQLARETLVYEQQYRKSVGLLNPTTSELLAQEVLDLSAALEESRRYARALEARLTSFDKARTTLEGRKV